MTESDPFEDAREKPRCTKVELRGPNVTSSLDKPPRPDALKAQQAAIRKHLHDCAPRRRRPEGP
ncbi:MAG TPA: hypothetical protein VK756_11385 [Solirubrobacteraceae bacterium]|jgi:hypothetical protein|nr:hypothetical protein [Solirubrobacteraceae bacterium]